ncbi:MAG TPA: hypothetical protein VFS42_01015 [Burkholderiaceae bacterium]|nr:hypothetical protein [Burkholderiaceae bacterium]
MVVDQIWRDESRNRDVPVRLRLPQPRNANERFPVILFSHGLGGGVNGGERWGEHWAANGYIVVHIQHLGSDESVLKSVENQVEALRSLRLAATSNQLIDRSFDVRFVIDELNARPEFKNADLNRIGMSGHSFGALTTQAIAGQKFRVRGPQVADSRVRAAIALSPTVRNRVDAETQFGDVTMPFMCITGTQDREVLGLGVAPQERTRPFYAMPAGGKYLVVFSGADHRVFGGSKERVEQPRPAGAERVEPHVQQATAALTLAFWDAYLKDIPQARRWLSTQARRVLDAQDRFERR